MCLATSSGRVAAVHGGGGEEAAARFQRRRASDHTPTLMAALQKASKGHAEVRLCDRLGRRHRVRRHRPDSTAPGTCHRQLAGPCM